METYRNILGALLKQRALSSRQQKKFSYVFKGKMKRTPREYVQEIYNRYEI